MKWWKNSRNKSLLKMGEHLCKNLKNPFCCPTKNCSAMYNNNQKLQAAY
jgi:hypothetical protein